MSGEQAPGRIWVSLMIGNSKLHWAAHTAAQSVACIAETWDSPHLHPSEPDEYERQQGDAGLPLACVPEAARQLLAEGGWQLDPSGASFLVPQDGLWMASVVPREAELWRQRCSAIRCIAGGEGSDVIAMAGGAHYPTLGVDRALALRGAGSAYSFPVLAIDCGSAMTYNGANAAGEMEGGAIVPGLRLQLQALGAGTAQVNEVDLPACDDSHQLPQCWALSTKGAVLSGVVRTMLAGAREFVRDWWSRHADSHVVITGGGGALLHCLLAQSWRDREPAEAERWCALTKLEPDLVHMGIAVYRAGPNPSTRAAPFGAEHPPAASFAVP
eukprot:TRINITY_DN15482_c0_g1_i1.p1 TRINITY_DN15482_c0_g1~~TRINITY_DN15482_c0_g1_i1.p1  ORF type:complete len:328 (-),score=69.19 TRINITY_DN15482_c0_g1_i1:796-1779(-)